MNRKFFVAAVMLSLALALGACGHKTGQGQKTETATQAGPATKTEQVPQPAAPAEDPLAAAAKVEGEAVAQEILDTFDKAVAEAAELTKDKPEASAIKPQLEGLIEKYKKPMSDLNLRFLALKDKDIRAFGAANGYMGEKRGRHVYDLYNENALGPAIAYYNIEKNEQEVVDLLTNKLIELIDIAVKMQ